MKAKKANNSGSLDTCRRTVSEGGMPQQEQQEEQIDGSEVKQRDESPGSQEAEADEGKPPEEVELPRSAEGHSCKMWWHQKTRYTCTSV